VLIDIFGNGSRTRTRIYIFEEPEPELDSLVPLMCGTRTGTDIFEKEKRKTRTTWQLASSEPSVPVWVTWSWIRTKSDFQNLN
jgi:hypothetical protein